MAQKKSIWRRIFSGDASEETGLSVADKKSIMETLASEYGLTIQHDDESAGELIKRNYRRMDGDELARIDQIFQFIPQIVANSANQRAVSAAFKAATEGTFRVRLGAGMHLCRSRLTQGAYRGVGLSDATNQIAGNAELFANSATLSVSNAPQLALGVFNVASMVTGQYFMSQINSKLAFLSSSVNKLEKLLDAQRHGKMKTAAQEVSDLMARAEFIICDTDKTNQAIVQIQRIQSRVNDEMNTCQELIASELRDMNINDGEDRIKEHVDAVARNLVEYKYAAQLYGLATLLEVQLRNMTDPEELRVYREQIDRRVNQFNQDYEMSYAALREYLEKTHALNDKGIAQWIASGAADLASTLTGRGIDLSPHLGGKILGFVDDLFSDHRKQQKEKISEQVNRRIASLEDTLTLESPAAAINLYIDSVGKEIEFVRIGGEYYTNLPKT